ncbi:MAG TPA: transposase [Ktedonobacteraceae bacterium]|jgi:putative transposase|nr:transposase [Ktedonobacteraceae bacterium]
MLLCKKIKIEVSQQDAEALEFMQGKCRGLYNWWVMKLRAGERWSFKRAKQSLRESKQYDPELRYVYGKLLAEVYFRLDKAMHAFFRRLEAGEKPGFPRVKPRHQFFTLCYPAMYLEVQGKTIILPTGGGGNWGPKRYPNIVARLTEEPPAHFREVAVSRDACGNYYCSFVYDDAQQDGSETPQAKMKRKLRPPPSRRREGVVAFDLGIKTLATGVNDQGRFYYIGGFKGYRWYNKQLDKIRSKRDKCKKKSRRYLYLSRVYKRVSEKERRKQQDCLHKASHLIAHRLAERAVVIGDLSQRQMVLKKQEHETAKERRKRQIRNRLVYNDWGLYRFVQMLEYKCLRSGKTLHVISERDTTKTCHRCGCKQAMPLWQRTYCCQNCGLVMDRDENSALNIYQRFLARLGPHTSAI